jgi:hypothetical protein
MIKSILKELSLLVIVLVSIYFSAPAFSNTNELPEGWSEDLFGGWFDKVDEPWQSQIEGVMPDIVAVMVIIHKPAVQGSTRAQLLFSYLFVAAKAAGNELTAPLVSKLGLQLTEIESQTVYWERNNIFGRDRKASALAAAILAETAKADINQGKNRKNKQIQKCWQRAFVCFDSETKFLPGQCKAIAKKIFEKHTC